jgi:hypothetical protein
MKDDRQRPPDSGRRRRRVRSSAAFDAEVQIHLDPKTIRKNDILTARLIYLALAVGQGGIGIWAIVSGLALQKEEGSVEEGAIRVIVGWVTLGLAFPPLVVVVRSFLPNRRARYVLAAACLTGGTLMLVVEFPGGVVLAAPLFASAYLARRPPRGSRTGSRGNS